MTANAFGTAARTVALALVLAAAAAVGLVVGNALNGRADTNAGYPAGWQGGAAAPIARTAQAAFSLDAIAAVQAARGDAKPAPYVDYGLRHAAADDDEQPTKESLAKPTLR